MECCLPSEMFDEIWIGERLGEGHSVPPPKTKRIFKFTVLLQSLEPLTTSKCFMLVMCCWLWGSVCEQQGVPAAVRAGNLIVLLWSGGVFTAVWYECLCKTSVLVFRADDQSYVLAPLRDVEAPEMITSHSRKLNELSKPGWLPSSFNSGRPL